MNTALYEKHKEGSGEFYLELFMSEKSEVSICYNVSYKLNGVGIFTMYILFVHICG